eukprot:1093021_1
MNHQETTTKSMKQMISIDITRAQFLYNINTHDVPHPTKTNPNPQSIKKKQKKNETQSIPNQNKTDFHAEIDQKLVKKVIGSVSIVCLVALQFEPRIHLIFFSFFPLPIDAAVQI